MSPKFLITGATSGLGASVLHTLYHQSSDKASIVAASSRPESASILQERYPGIEFRRAEYGDLEGLVEAFKDVEMLFFVSSPEADSAKREVQHKNVVDAAKEAGVGRVYYSSLAFNGYEPYSVVGLQRAHITTERLLKESGMNYVSVREGVYTDAFPVFMSWYPNTTTLYLPGDGRIAFSSREELGEATALLMLRDPKSYAQHTQDNIVLLTANKTYTFADVARAISAETGQPLTIEEISYDEYPDVLAAEDAKPGRGGKSRAFFEGWISLVDGVARGEAATTSPLMGELLAREPRDAMDHVKSMISKEGGYTWHQNYAMKN